jgi:hypothetical protein
MSVSSVATALRTETDHELQSQDFLAAQRALRAPMEMVYGSAKRWLASRSINAVLLFNGRMDLTAALAAACKDAGIAFIAVERSWFGHGLKLIPNENCLGLRQVNRLSDEFRSQPLLSEQAALAGRIAADRFRQQNTFEWRLYNRNAIQSDWPSNASADSRVLILPSSRNEFEGHPDFACEWTDYTLAVDMALARLGVDGRDCVVRCHPNWGERIGRNTGARSEKHWVNWAQRRGITAIRSADRISTYALLRAADLVIVNGSSAGVEAGLLGCRVICVGHAAYEKAGFTVNVFGPDDASRLELAWPHDREAIARRALRYVYTHGRRFTQFARFVRARSTLAYEYFDGADAGRLVRLCRSGELEADDERVATSDEAENEVVSSLLSADWEQLGRWEEEEPSGVRLSIRRRRGLRWIDFVRNQMARGDL